MALTENQMKFCEDHPVLYHYTNAGGLQGILEKHQVWATDIRYLNDSMERSMFLEKRLPSILPAPVAKALATLAKTEEAARQAINEMGGMDKAIQQTAWQFAMNITEHTKKFGQPFITSFCTPAGTDVDDGLLSQWRGYGKDGGYALVFDTAGLLEHMDREHKDYGYEHFGVTDVYYLGDGKAEQVADEDIRKMEQQIDDAVHEYLMTRETDSFENMFTAMNTLSCCTKHHGFAEEREVRVIAIPIGDYIYSDVLAGGDKRSRKQIHHRTDGGTLVPFIKLFNDTEAAKSLLPLKKIIVGPHADRTKRAESAQSLLGSQGYKTVEVIASKIPYICK